MKWSWSALAQRKTQRYSETNVCETGQRLRPWYRRQDRVRQKTARGRTLKCWRLGWASDVSFRKLCCKTNAFSCHPPWNRVWRTLCDRELDTRRHTLPNALSNARTYSHALSNALSNVQSPLKRPTLSQTLAHTAIHKLHRQKSLAWHTSGLAEFDLLKLCRIDSLILLPYFNDQYQNPFWWRNNETMRRMCSVYTKSVNHVRKKCKSYVKKIGLRPPTAGKAYSLCIWKQVVRKAGASVSAQAQVSNNRHFYASGLFRITGIVYSSCFVLLDV